MTGQDYADIWGSYVLWSEALKGAVGDAGSRNTLRKYQARRWFESNRDCFKSFLWVCELLHVNAEYIRKNLDYIYALLHNNPKIKFYDIFGEGRK